jgi:four helix bundle protein
MGSHRARQALPVTHDAVLGMGLTARVLVGLLPPSVLKEAVAMNHHQHNIPSLGSSLPHHRLHVYRKALELLAAVRAAQVTDAKLRDEALRAAKGVCLNIAEGSGRVSRADKARVYAIARVECVECVECVAAVEIAGSARGVTRTTHPVAAGH